MGSKNRNLKAKDRPDDLTPFITRTTQDPVSGGAFGDVWKCNYNAKRGLSTFVAVKAFRFPKHNDLKRINRKITREIGILTILRHNNIVPLLGTATGFGWMPGLPCLVTPWIPNGTLNTYLASNHNDLTVLDRMRMVKDVSAGLCYLHSVLVVHGDITGANILIDDGGRARLIDFGLSTIVRPLLGQSHLAATSIHPGAIRYAAPELVLSDDVRSLPLEKTDVYSFGCVMLQILSGRHPWSEIKSEKPELRIVMMLAEGRGPQRPDGHPVIRDSDWDIISRCLLPWPELRPSADEVLDLAAASPQLQRVPTHIATPITNIVNDNPIPEQSHHSLPSSLRQFPLHHPNHSPSHFSQHRLHSTYFPYPSEDLQQPIAQGQFPHQSSPQNLPTLGWSQNYPSQYMDAATWQRHPPTGASHTIQNQHLQQGVHMIHHPPFTHWRSPSQSHLVGLSHVHHQAALASDHTWGQMKMNPAAAFQGPESTSTGQNHALNLEGSPSWNSTTTQMQMQEYDHFYPVQQEWLHGRQPHQESSHQHHPSHSSIEHPSQATHYSHELRRQQLQQQRIAQARRRSGKAEFLHNFGTTYHQHQQQGPYFPLTEETSHHHPYQMLEFESSEDGKMLESESSEDGKMLESESSEDGEMLESESSEDGEVS